MTNSSRRDRLGNFRPTVDSPVAPHNFQREAAPAPDRPVSRRPPRASTAGEPSLPRTSLFPKKLLNCFPYAAAPAIPSPFPLLATTTSLWLWTPAFAGVTRDHPRPRPFDQRLGAAAARKRGRSRPHSAWAILKPGGPSRRLSTLLCHPRESGGPDGRAPRSGVALDARFRGHDTIDRLRATPLRPATRRRPG